MILAEIPEQLIFVVVMLVIAAIKAMGEKFGKKPESAYEEHQEHEEDHSVENDYEEYARQLRERQAEILARQQQTQQTTPPPPLPNAAPVVFEKPYTPPVVKKPKLSAAEQKALENFQKDSSKPSRRISTTIGGTARARARRVLSSPTAARDAIVLSEILGPPKGQRG